MSRVKTTMVTYVCRSCSTARLADVPMYPSDEEPNTMELDAPRIKKLGCTSCGEARIHAGEWTLHAEYPRHP